MTENIDNIGADRIVGNCKFFRASELLEVFNAEFFREARCREWILKYLHKDGAYCPQCKNEIIDETTLNNFWNLRRCKCKNCNKWFSAYNNTFLYNSHLTPQEAVLFAVLIAQVEYLKIVAKKLDIHPDTINSLQIAHFKVIAKMLGIHPDTVKLWQKRFRMYEGEKGNVGGY